MSGFPPEAMGFLADLKANNRRDWFAEHRPLYDRAIRGPTETLAAELAGGLSDKLAEPVVSKIFRIQRDVRFAKDKSPFNAHVHVAFWPGGHEMERGGPGFYLALEPDRLMLGTGVFELSGAPLDAYRRAAAGDAGEDLADLLADLTGQGLRPDGSELKRVPAPYPADHPRAGLLRRKGLSLWRDVEDRSLIASPDLSAACLDTFEALAPLYRWLAEALAD
jgi:uncharacterized protein (TIGR02453 family)